VANFIYKDLKKMYRVLFINLLLTLAVFASEIVATVNGKDITQSDVDRYLVKSMPGAKFSFMNNAQKDKVIDKLIERELYLEVAKKEGIEGSSAFARELKKVKENLILDIWMKNRLKDIKVSSSEIYNYYRKNNSKFHQSESASARHILVSTEREAREIINELKFSSNLKEKFIQLAKTRSTGPSATNGGDLGWFSRDQMVPEFSEATFKLSKGEITKVPVQTHFGYHIIYLTDKRAAGTIEFSKVKEKIASALKIKKFNKELKKLSKKLKNSADFSVKYQKN